MHIGILSEPSNFHCEKWAQALARAGAQVTVYGFEDNVQIPGVRVVRVPAPFTHGARVRYPAFYLSAGRLQRILDEDSIDVLHPLHLSPWGSWGLWCGHRPMISAAMGADVLEYPPHKQYDTGFRTWREAEVQRGFWATRKAQLLNRFYRARVQDVISHSDLVIADNQPLVDAINNWFTADPARVRLLRWGLERELLQFTDAQRAATRAQYGIPAHHKVLLSPRGANALYQADIIIEAIAQVLPLPAFAEYTFVVLGAGYSLSQRVGALAAQLTAQYPNFRYIPHRIPRLDVYSLWGITDVFISAPIYDGYSAAVAEGRYVGAIPVVNAIPGNLEVITHQENGIVVEPFLPTPLAQALQDVAANLPEYQARFAPRNRAWIVQHSLIDSNATRLLEWAQQLLRL